MHLALSTFLSFFCGADWTLSETSVSGAASRLCRIHFPPYGPVHVREGNILCPKWPPKLKPLTNTTEAARSNEENAPLKTAKSQKIQWCSPYLIWLFGVFVIDNDIISFYRTSKRKCLAAPKHFSLIWNGSCTTASSTMEVGLSASPRAASLLGKH